jgi:hypothetical protein
MEAEDQEFCEIMEGIQAATFHMDDETARPIIDEFIKTNPQLLEFHEKEWYDKYC